MVSPELRGRVERAGDVRSLRSFTLGLGRCSTPNGGTADTQAVEVGEILEALESGFGSCTEICSGLLRFDGDVLGSG